jgi:hypothetical protein
MSRIGLVFAVVSLILCPLVSSAHAEGPTFSIDEIVEAIELEIMGAQAIEEGNPTVRITSFSLSLSVVATKRAKSLIEFRVPGIEEGASSGFSSDTIHTLVINVTLSEKVSVTPIASNRGLLPAIQNIKSTLRKAYSVHPVFETQSLSFTIDFAVVRTDKGNYALHVIEAGKPEYKNFVTHKLTLKMAVVN